MRYKDPDYQRKYRKAHKEQIKEYRKEYYQKNKEEAREYCKKYHRKNREKLLKRMKKYRETHKEQTKEYNETHRKQFQDYGRMRRNNPQYKLSRNISCLIYQSLKSGKNGNHWEKLIGYTLNDLMQHLEKQFTSEMSWKNYGFYWVIDHKIPISVFNFDSYDNMDFRRCWALENLQPLEKTENMQKHNKINENFQPSLKI